MGDKVRTRWVAHANADGCSRRYSLPDLFGSAASASLIPTLVLSIIFPSKLIFSNFTLSIRYLDILLLYYQLEFSQSCLSLPLRTFETQNILNPQKGAPSVLRPKLPSLLRKYRKKEINELQKSNYFQRLHCILTHRI